MKYVRTFIFMALAFLATPALAQWQIPANAVPYGLGGGKQGFGSASNTGAGTSCLRNTAPPTFGACAAAGGTSGQIQYNNAGVLGGFTASGDATLNTGTGLLTLASVGPGATGPFGSATVAPVVTIDAKGRVTGLTSATVTPAVGSITGLGTGAATALGVNVGTAGSVVVNGGALGTPSSGTLTNATGLPTTGLTGTLQAAQEPAHTGGVTNTAGSLALTVITNANLTGDVTSVGNATTLTNAPVIAKVLTGYAAGAGTVAATDSILQALQKLGGLVDNAAWGTYAPATTCNTGAGTWTTNTAKFKAIGKTVHWQIDVTLTALGTCANAVWKFNLPSTPASGGGGAGSETATSGASIICSHSGGSAVATCVISGVNLTVNQRFVASGVYEGP